MALFFDLEFYVPPDERNDSNIKMTFNPTKSSHLVLGGVIFVGNPTRRTSSEQYNQVWLWDQEGFENVDFQLAEKHVLTKIYELFKEEYRRSLKRMKESGNTNTNPLIYTIGAGIARNDLNILYIKAKQHKIDTPDKLFEIFLGTFPIDLNNAAIGFMTNNNGNIVRPVPMNKILKQFEMNAEKESGIVVWDYFDKFEYEQIQNRTRKEVVDIVEIYHRMREELQNP